MVRLVGGDGHGRWRTRVRGLPETFGDVPSAALAEEMETPGAGQIRALITFAGNPVLSIPNGGRLARALAKLDFMVSIDLYVNETTRHADVILPPAWSLAEDHLDVVFPNFSVRNVVRWSPPVVKRGADERHDWEILLELAERLGGGPTGIPVADAMFRLGRRVGLGWSPTRLLTMALRLGPFGDRYLAWSKGLNLRKLAAAPHGIDLGPLEPGFARRVFHRDRRMHLAAPPFVTGTRELLAAVERGRPADELLLIGRREARTNNSWMHNVHALVAGRERCVLYVHPDDAARAGARDGETVVLESRVHRGEVRIKVTDDMRPGIVSLPHGWGHAASAPWQQVASAHAGVSVNDWTDDGDVESLVGQSILNGVPVRLHRHDARGDTARVA
jgi:anaerobic selenocysteine-containing dehydrogenase